MKVNDPLSPFLRHRHSRYQNAKLWRGPVVPVSNSAMVPVSSVHSFNERRVDTFFQCPLFCFFPQKSSGLPMTASRPICSTPTNVFQPSGSIVSQKFFAVVQKFHPQTEFGVSDAVLVSVWLAFFDVIPCLFSLNHR